MLKTGAPTKFARLGKKAAVAEMKASPPAVGSVWKAGDGRFLQVISAKLSPFAKGYGRAHMRVLPPLQPRQRTETFMNFAQFGSFLTPITYDQLVEHDPGLGAYDAIHYPFIFRFLRGRDQKEMADSARKMGVILCFHPVGGPDDSSDFGNTELLALAQDAEDPEWKKDGMSWIGAWMNEDNEVTSIYARPSTPSV
ncbi:hypothetical protein [Acetobacter persici]|uniref:Uncharacterized protein n=1 Tax=Acetobacter persici TaxID=1076596 RepID=A0A1U9LJC5_9PROT|nr:hypothetical protein [Acetobacter persici]AQT06546.1 hypothetical protein A0U91_16190 [Acetobacter persici]